MSQQQRMRAGAAARSPSPSRGRLPGSGTSIGEVVGACCCYLTALPNEDCDPDDSLVITAEESTTGEENGAALHIRNPSGEGDEATLHYPFTAVFPSPQKFSQHCYRKSVAPLVAAAAAGGSTVFVVGGRSSLLGDLHGYLLSNRTMQGLISQAAGELLDSVNSSDGKFGAVTFSWYRIECSSPSSEVLCDVLKTASQQQQQHQPNHQPSVEAVTSNSNNSGLVLRDIGKGRGMGVPGLWEIEISSGKDIEEVVDHVLKILPTIADHSTGIAHSVMQLTVTNHQIAEEERNPSSGGSVVTAAASAGVADGPGVGRVSFVMLSNLTAQQQVTRAPTSRSRSKVSSTGNDIGSSSDIAGSYKVGSTYSWVEQAKIVTQWLESKQPSPPFHKSRLLLLLKDVLMQRQKASFLLILRPSLDMQSENLRWLDLFARMCKDRLSHVNYIDRSDHQTPSSTHSRGESGVRTRSASPIARFGGSSNPLGTRNTRSAPAPNAVNGEFISDDIQVGRSNAGCTRSTTQTKETKQEERTSIASRLAGTSMSSSAFQGMELKKDFVGYNIRTANIARNNSPMGVAKRQAQAAIVPFPGSPGSAASAVSAGMDASMIQRYEETETALQMALEASRSESSALKMLCDQANEKYEELRQQYEELVDRLKEEGPFLVKRDRDRLKNALKDLHGYEIYKEVMEAAMARLQHELETVNRENTEIKAQRSKEVKQARKQKDFSDKYTKDLVVTKRKLNEAEQKVQHLEGKLKQVLKEKETAVFALAQSKAVGSQKDGQKKAVQEARRDEIEELKIRLNKMESKCAALQCDKDAMLAAHASEAASLRAAQSKALEMLMSYQEENDILRSAVGDVSELKGVSFKRPLTAAASQINPQNNSALAAAGMLSRKPSSALSPPPPPPTGNPVDYTQSEIVFTDEH